MKTKCDRCGASAQVTIMSKFNTDILCMSCKQREREHPRYEEADAAEVAAVRRGDYNFPGIGKPSDL
jgi:hypothetical protein